MPHAQVNGAKLYYERQGAGQSVLLIQGVGCIGRVWRPQVEELRRDHDCILFDNRGIGTSTGSVENLSIAQMAADSVALLDALGIERAHLVGHSMGGVIAQEIALTVPGRIMSLALLCTLHRGKDAIVPTWPLIRNGLLTNVGTLPMRRRAFARMVSSPEYLKQVGIDAAVAQLSACFERDVAKLPAIASRQIRAMSKHDQSARLHELASVPSLVLAGRHDPIGRPALAALLAQALQATHIHVWDDASHALTIQQASRVNALLREHLSGASI